MPTPAKQEKEWKFTLDQWHELPDIPAFVGSTFIINRIEMTRTNSDNFRYDIYIAPLPQQNHFSEIYKSVMDVAKSNRTKRSNKKKSKKTLAKDRKAK